MALVIPLKGEEALPERPEDSVLVFDYGNMFSEGQQNSLQIKAGRILQKHNQVVVIFTSNEHSAKGNGGADVCKLAGRSFQKWWPATPKKSLDDILNRRKVKFEEADEWLELMNSRGVLLIAFEAATGEAAVEASARANPEHHERKHLMREYVMPLASRGETFKAASLGLDAIEARLAKKPLPPVPSSFKSTMKIVAALAVIGLVLYGAFGRSESFAPFYYIGYFFTVLGGLFAAQALQSGQYDRRNRHRREDTLKDMQGIFKG